LKGASRPGHSPRAALFLPALLLAASLAAGPPAAARLRVILVGDSTLATRTGYGDALCGLFRWQSQCLNLARGGRSTKSFRADGSWDRVAALLSDSSRPTWVLLQFGHNDQPGKAERATDLATEFPFNLGRYLDEIQAAGARAVLVTPLARRQFGPDGRLRDDLGPWAAATREVARARKVPLVDLHAASVAAIEAMGPAAADVLAMAPSPHKDYDRTHVGARGAALFARTVAAAIALSVPELGRHLVVGAVELPGRIARPQLTTEQARSYSYRAVLGGWDPAAESAGQGWPPDLVVDASTPGDGRATFPTIQTAVDAATARAARTPGVRVRIQLRPGTYDEQVLVPEAPAPISIEGEGPDAGAVRIRARPAGGIASAVVRVRNRGFRAAHLTIENSHNKERGDFADQTQAVALALDDADRVHLENVRLLGYQDTFFLAASSPGRLARAFVDRSYVEGDMDFIFGEATAFFRATEIRSLGDRAVSYALAPSTHRASRYGFVFEGCAFTHDGSPNALGGFFKLARQWNRGPDAVGKVAILRSTIGAHIDRERPWADWSIGTPRHRPVQYDSGEPGSEPWLAEYDNREEPH